MATYITAFLKTEITAIPKLLDKYVGKNYSNTLCNGALWMFVTWNLIHTTFDIFIEALLRKMGFKSHQRSQIKSSLWNIGFNGCACAYYTAIFLEKQSNIRELMAPIQNISSNQLILGFIVLLSFYLHSTLWELLKFNHSITAASHFCLAIVLCISYFIGFVEGFFRITFPVNLSQIILEFTRCIAIISPQQETIIKCFYFCNLTTFVFSHLIILPLMLYNLTLSKLSITSIFFLYLILGVWIFIEVCNSILYKTIAYWLFKEEHCCQNVVQYSLFPPRDDAAYTMNILRKEIKAREEKAMLMRRPKNRNMVMQTLKCMVAIKRKISEKRKLSHLGDPGNNCDETPANQTPDTEQVVGGKLQFNIKNGDEKVKED